jgi:ABC-2 type transport system permease protein
VIFGAIFVLGGAFQSAAGNAAEVANAFTYGGNFLTQYPPTIFAPQTRAHRDVHHPPGFRQLATGMYVLDHTDPLGLPRAFAFASPVAALAIAVLVAPAWRTGVRGYRSAGS